MAARTKIAYILTPITFGGAEKVSLNFLRTVDRDRFDIKPILLTRPWEDEPYFAQEVRQLGYAFDTLPVALRTHGDFLRVPRVAWRLFTLLKQGTFDLVHTHGYFADICGLPAASLLGMPCISTCHGFIANDRKLKTYNVLDKYVLRRCKTVIAVSDGIRADLVSSGISDSRITVIANAVAPTCGAGELITRRQVKRHSLGVAPQEYLLGYIGRLSEEKGLVYLLEAAAALCEAALPVKVLLVGEGLEQLALEARVKALGLGGVVIFSGFQSDIENWLPALDVFVLPSLTEGTPMALLEAMAAGLPVVATAVGGVPKVVTDGVDGLLVPAGDPGSLSDKISWLIANPDLRHQMGRAGHDTIVARYGIEPWCRAIENCYLKALAKIL